MPTKIVSRGLVSRGLVSRWGLALGLAALFSLNSAAPALAQDGVVLDVAPPPGVAADGPASEAPPQSAPQPGRDLPVPPEQFLQQMADNLSATLPRKIDGITTLERVTAEGRTVVYRTRLSRRDGTDEALAAFVRKTVVPDICAKPMTRGLIDVHGVTFRHLYLFPDSQTPVTVDTDAEACAKAGIAAPVTDPIAQALQKVAAERNAAAPTQVDPFTMVERVSSEGRMLVFYYRVTRNDVSSEPEIAAFLKTMSQRLCADTDARRMIDTYGITYRYNYAFPKRDEPAVVDIDAAACAAG